MGIARKWPYKANGFRLDAIARMKDIEAFANASLASARQRGDVDEVLRQAQIVAKAQAAKFDLELAYHAGRE